MDKQNNFFAVIRYKTYIHLLIIILVGFTAYSNTFDVPFTWDDTINITQNPFIANFGSFLDPKVANDSRFPPAVRDGSIVTRYMGFLSFALNYSFFGNDKYAYHAVNLCIHLINSIMVYFLVVLTFRSPFFCSAPPHSSDEQSRCLAGLFAALLFVSHPIQTQAVTYIVQRLASLATMFCLFSLVMYIKFRLSGSVRVKAMLYALALISAVAAMITKEISFTLPVVVALYEFMFFKGTLRKRTAMLAPLLFTMSIIPTILLTIKGSFSAIRITPVDPLSRYDYLITQFRVLITYLRLLIFPVDQNLDYDYPVYHSVSDPNVYLSLIFLLSLFAAAIFFLHRSRLQNPKSPYLRLIAFGILWFFITLTVESSIIPIEDVIFEHRLYLPSIGLICSFIASSLVMHQWLVHKIPSAARLVVPVLVLIVLILAGATYARNNVWRDTISLWEDVALKSPRKARVHSNLGVAYSEHLPPRNADAIREYQTAISLKPDAIEPHINLGNEYRLLGKYDDATRELLYALERKPYHSLGHNNLGVVYVAKGQYDKAIISFNNAIKLDPDSADPHNNLGLVFERTGRIEEAVNEYRIAVKLNPAIINCLSNVGSSMIKGGKLNDAIRRYNIVLKLKSDMAPAHYNLALAYEKKGLYAHAIAEYKKAVGLEPKLHKAHYNIAIIYKKQGRIRNAIDELEIALKINSGFQDAADQLRILRKSKDLK